MQERINYLFSVWNNPLNGFNETGRYGIKLKEFIQAGFIQYYGNRILII